MRSQEQQYWDLFTVLRLLESVDEPDNLKIQKLTFLHELKGQDQGLQSAHYKFFRYTLGPFSKILARDVEFLEERGFITKTTRQLTKRGRFLLELLSDEVRSPRARRALELQDETIREYGKVRSPKLVDRVYAMEVPVFDLGGERLRVKDISTFLDILDPVHSNLADVEPFDPDTVGMIREELKLDPAVLEPTHPSYQAAVRGALEKVDALLK